MELINIWIARTIYPNILCKFTRYKTEMKNVEGQCRLWKDPNGDYRLNLTKPQTVIGKLVELNVKNYDKFKEKYFDIVIRPVAIYKSNKQLGYWKAEVVPKAAWGFTTANWQDMTEEKAEKMLKEMYLTETVLNTDTGEYKTFTKSLADATKEEVADLINKSVIFLSSELGVECEDPDDFKKRNLKSNFE